MSARSGSYIMRSGSFEAQIEGNEGNMIFGHSGSVRFINANAPAARAHLTSSVSGSMLSTEWILGIRETDKPFWVFKPDGRIQYSQGGKNKVNELDLAEKLSFTTRSSHDATEKFENFVIEERTADEEKGKVKGGENTYDKGLIVSGTNPFLSFYKTSTGALTQITDTRYFYVSGTYPWSIFQSVNGNESYYGANASVSITPVPSVFWFSSSGDFYTSGIVSSSGIHYMPTASIGGGIFTSASLAAGGGGGGGDVSLGDNVNFGNITASGDISASGRVTANNATIATELHMDSANIRFGPNDSDGILLGNPTQGTFTVTNPDDVSDHYLTVTANSVELESGQYLDIKRTADATDASGDTGALRVEGGASIAKKVFVGTDLNVGGSTITSHITASGNISSSEGFILGYVDNSQKFISASLDKFVIRTDDSSAAVPRLEMKTTNLVSKIDSLRQNAGTNLDLILQSENAGSGNSRVGIVTTTPTKTLTVAGDISASGEYYGKWKCTSTHAFYVTNNSVNFIPMAASLNESSFADSYYHRNIAPYDGRLVRVMLVCQNNDPGTVSVGLTTGSGASGLTKDNGEICTIASCVDDTSYTFDFTGSGATFNKGEDVGIQFQQANSVANGTYITAVWEYDSGGT